MHAHLAEIVFLAISLYYNIVNKIQLLELSLKLIDMLISVRVGECSILQTNFIPSLVAYTQHPCIATIIYKTPDPLYIWAYESEHKVHHVT